MCNNVNSGDIHMWSRFLALGERSFCPAFFEPKFQSNGLYENNRVDYAIGEVLQYKESYVVSRRPLSQKELLEARSTSGYRSTHIRPSLIHNNNREKYQFHFPLYLNHQGDVPRQLLGMSSRTPVISSIAALGRRLAYAATELQESMTVEPSATKEEAFFKSLVGVGYVPPSYGTGALFLQMTAKC